MRVLALITEGFGGSSGIAQYNRDLLQALSCAQRVREVVVLPRAGACAATPPDKIRQLAATPGKIAYVRRALSTALRQGPFDVIFCGHMHYAPVAAALAPMTGARIWLQAHGIDAWSRPSRLMRESTARATLITTVSRYTRARLLEWSDIQPARVRVAPNTFRPMFKPGRADPAVLARHGLTGRAFAVTVARIDRADSYKGHGRVIAAMARVRRQIPDALYVVAGDGDGAADLRALAARCGVADAVMFLGRVGDDETLALYRAARLFVMPSTKEGFGIVFLEAAASGLPVIGGCRDGSLDALADGEIGRLIDPLDPDQLVDALLDGFGGRIVAHPQAAARFAHGHFNAHVEALVETLVARRIESRD